MDEIEFLKKLRDSIDAIIKTSEAGDTAAFEEATDRFMLLLIKAERLKG